MGVGESAVAVISTSASPGAPAEGADQAHSTGAFESAQLVPARLQASLFFSVEDAARVAGLSDALRMNLTDALADELDDQILTNSTNGLFSGSNLADNDASAVGTFVTLKKRIVYDAIDGRYAANAGDLRVVLGSASYAFAGGIYRGNNSDVPLLDGEKRRSDFDRAHVARNQDSPQGRVPQGRDTAQLRFGADCTTGKAIALRVQPALKRAGRFITHGRPAPPKRGEHENRI